MQNREWRGSEDAKREAVGSELQIRWEQSVAAHLYGPFCASWALPVCFGEPWTPQCAPSAPWLSLRGYPKPWCPFRGNPTPWFVLCHAQAPALPLGTPGPWLCLFGLPTALREPFGVHRASPWDFLCHRALGVPLGSSAHSSVCEHCLGFT